MNQATEQFLATCLKYGLKRVNIMVAHPNVPESVSFVFGPKSSVFGLKRKGSTSHNHNGWPAIWAVVNELKISGGAGNSNQHQITLQAQRELEPGAYHRVNGKWRKL